MARGSNSKKVQEWTERLARFQKSPLSVKPFCEEEDVSTAAFYQWRRKLAARPLRQDTCSQADSRRTGFQLVQLTSEPPARQTPDSALTIRLPSGIQVDVAPRSDVIQTVLRELLDARHLAQRTRS